MPGHLSLLPPNATPLERAIEQTMAERLALPVLIDELWNPETCPAHLLGFLAWAQSVDVWEAEWSEATKRNVIAASFDVHRKKGTVGAVRRALEALGIETVISEWYEYGGDPHTFRIEATGEQLIAAGLPLGAKLAALVGRLIDQVKPERTHYSLRVGETFTSPGYWRSGDNHRLSDTSEMDISPAARSHDHHIYASVGMRVRRVCTETILFEREGIA